MQWRHRARGAEPERGRAGQRVGFEPALRQPDFVEQRRELRLANVPVLRHHVKIVAGSRSQHAIDEVGHGDRSRVDLGPRVVERITLAAVCHCQQRVAETLLERGRRPAFERFPARHQIREHDRRAGCEIAVEKFVCGRQRSALDGLRICREGRLQSQQPLNQRKPARVPRDLPRGGQQRMRSELGHGPRRQRPRDVRAHELGDQRRGCHAAQQILGRSRPEMPGRARGGAGCSPAVSPPSAVESGSSFRAAVGRRASVAVAPASVLASGGIIGGRVGEARRPPLPALPPKPNVPPTQGTKLHGGAIGAPPKPPTELLPPGAGIGGTLNPPVPLVPPTAVRPPLGGGIGVTTWPPLPPLPRPPEPPLPAPATGGPTIGGTIGATIVPPVASVRVLPLEPPAASSSSSSSSLSPQPDESASSPLSARLAA